MLSKDCPVSVTLLVVVVVAIHMRNGCFDLAVESRCNQVVEQRVAIDHAVFHDELDDNASF